MSINRIAATAAIFVASMGTIAGACKRTGATGTQETSTIPNNSVPDNKPSAFSSNEIISPRKLGAKLASH
jgi:hypothetical protein